MTLLSSVTAQGRFPPQGEWSALVLVVVLTHWKGFPEGREWWEKWPHQHPYLKIKVYPCHWGKQSQNAIEVKAMHSSGSWLPARNPCKSSTVQHYPALCWASQCKGSTQQSPQYLPIFITSQGTALSAQPLHRARTHHRILSSWQCFIWPDGFNRQDPTVSVMSSIILPCPVSPGSRCNEKPFFQFPFLIPHPSLQSCYLFWWKRDVSMPFSITWAFSSKNNSQQF